MDKIKATALETIDASRGSLVALADLLHSRPEVGFEEYASSSSLAEFLRRQGFVVEYPVGGVETAFRAYWGADKPAVAIVAEYDALPSIGHGCGHNLIAAGAMGAAIGVASVMSELEGSRGTAITSLRPAGKARIGTRPVNVVSRGEFIKEGEEIEVILVDGNRVVVKRID